MVSGRAERPMGSTSKAMLDSYPGLTMRVRQDTLTRCITACTTCSLACTACSDACLAENDLPMLVKCIRTNLDCADICDTTSKVLTRQTTYDPVVIRSVVDACLTAIQVCADECEIHAARHKHCEVCAMVCREAEASCRELLAELEAR